MSERPNAILAVLFAATAAFAALVLVGLAGLGATGVVGVATVLVGAFSACIFFVDELTRVPMLPLVVFVLGALSLVGLAVTAVVYVRQQRLLRALPLDPIDDRFLAAVARDAGIETLYVTPASRPAAFCFGLFMPRVVVTAGLVSRLTREEQAAALWHEAQHLRAREPLKCLLARLATSTFFWIPALGDLLERYLLAKELVADRLACERTSRSALAGALSEVVAAPAPAIGLAECATARIDRLFDHEAQLPPLFRRRHLLASGLAIGVLVVVTAFPARLDLAATAQLTMLTSVSLHGLPGMAAGLLVNASALGMLACVARRRDRKRTRRSRRRL